MMFGFLRKIEMPPVASGPVLDLSGPRLRRAFEDLVHVAEQTGGIERYVSALALKASLFEELLGKGKVADVTREEFLDLAAFVTPVRRRLGAWLAKNDFTVLRTRLTRLLNGWSDTTTVDQRLEEFSNAFPQDREHRWARDLGAEVLHFTAPDRYPLMTRWMWDKNVGTGVLREIWFADDVDLAKIDANDDFETFSMLSQELQGFLAENGVFRDLVYYADLLAAHVYAGYINDRGGQYLRSDFTTSGDPMSHTRRMLGLDAVDTETGRTRLKLIEGEVHFFGGAPILAGGIQ